MMGKGSGDVLTVENLTITLGHHGSAIVSDVSLRVPAGGCLALVGETGSGKSVTAAAALGLLPPGLVRAGGVVRLSGEDPAHLSRAAHRVVLARDTGYVPQDPLSAMDPYFSIGDQVAAPRAPAGLALLAELMGGLTGGWRPGRAARRQQATGRLAEVGITGARMPDAFPHMFSGGMRQRALIAAATAHGPALVVADEPTTALDASLERQVLTTLRKAVEARGAGLLLITHDLNLVAWYADRVCIMEAGRVVEEGPVERIFRTPKAAYTRALLAASPAFRQDCAPPRTKVTGPDVVRLSGVVRRYGDHLAVDRVDLNVAAGEFVAIVGRSGSGKSTLGRLLIALERPDAGRVELFGRDPWALPRAELRSFRRRFQPVFQDPLSALDPRWTIARSIAEPLLAIRSADAAEAALRTDALLRRVGMDGLGARFPHQLSGGQRQRATIARALATGPDLLLADEAVSALDVRTQVQILDLIEGVCRDDGVAVVFVTHDLRMVKSRADRVVVVHEGQIVEEGPAEAVLSNPIRPETKELVAGLLPLRFAPDQDKGDRK